MTHPALLMTPPVLSAMPVRVPGDFRAMLSFEIVLGVLATVVLAVLAGVIVRALRTRRPPPGTRPQECPKGCLHHAA